MREDPGQLLVEDRILRIVFDRLIPDQLDPFIDPAPAVFKTGTGHRNIVGHVPGKVGGRAGKGRLQVGDPARQLHHFKIVSLLLQRTGPQPEQVGHQPAETAQSHCGEDHHRRRILDLTGKTQPVFRHLIVETPLHTADAEEQADRDHDQHEIHGYCAEFIHLRITSPSSRRQYM